MHAILNRLTSRIAQSGLFGPSTCMLCRGESAAPLCASCRTRHFSLSRARCAVCAIPLVREAALCGACLARPPEFDASFAATDYAAPVDSMVLALKFSARLEYAALFADLIFEAMDDTPERPAFLTAVPLGPLRLRERGFNQALEIAKPLARRMNISVMPRLLSRTRETAAQSVLRPADRQRNIRSAFTVHPDAPALISGRHVGIVDDVMTTGETLNEVAATLKRFGAARVSNFVFARTPE